MAKQFYKKQEVLTLEDLQGLRESAKGFEKKQVQSQIDLFFHPPKPKRQKKEKRERRYRED